MTNLFEWISKKDTGTKIVAALGVVAVLTALITIPYAVITREGDEGLMILNGKELRWDKKDLPVGCFHDSTEVTSLHLGYYNAAREEINKRVGMTLLRPCVPWMLLSIPVHIKGAVTLRVNQPVDKEHFGGTTRHNYDKRTGRILSVSVRISPGAPPHLLEYIWLHEMGHVVGLTHDRTEDSIMYPYVKEGTKLSNKDAKVLQSAYKEPHGNTK